MMCQCRFTDCNKTSFTTWVQGVDGGGGCAHVGQGKYGGSWTWQFCYELKLLLKIKYFEKRTEDSYPNCSPILYFHT